MTKPTRIQPSRKAKTVKQISTAEAAEEVNVDSTESNGVVSAALGFAKNVITNPLAVSAAISTFASTYATGMTTIPQVAAQFVINGAGLSVAAGAYKALTSKPVANAASSARTAVVNGADAARAAALFATSRVFTPAASASVENIGVEDSKVVEPRRSARIRAKAVI